MELKERNLLLALHWYLDTKIVWIPKLWMLMPLWSVARIVCFGFACCDCIRCLKLCIAFLWKASERKTHKSFHFDTLFMVLCYVNRTIPICITFGCHVYFHYSWKAALNRYTNIYNTSCEASMFLLLVYNPFIDGSRLSIVLLSCTWNCFFARRN